MYLIPADRLRGSPFMTRQPSSVSIRKQKAPVKKRKYHSEAVKIRKHHPYEQWLKVRRKMDEADLRKTTETNVIADFLSRVMPTGQASKVSPPSTSSSAYASKVASRDADGRNGSINYRFPPTAAYERVHV